MADRRRVNAPPAGTSAIQFDYDAGPRAARTRAHDQPRKMFMRTGLVPAASGSAYLEVSNSMQGSQNLLLPPGSSLKLACTVHGPHPMPRSAPFAPQLALTAHIKVAPFAGSARKGTVRETEDKELAAHLEVALRGAIIADRWPKSGVDVVVTVLEAEEPCYNAGEADDGKMASMSTLAGCITVASAAIIDAGIDCFDAVAGGFAAIVSDSNGEKLVLDPALMESNAIKSACVVGYLPNRDEISSLWFGGNSSTEATLLSGREALQHEQLIDKAVDAAGAAHLVLQATLAQAM